MTMNKKPSINQGRRKFAEHPPSHDRADGSVGFSKLVGRAIKVVGIGGIGSTLVGYLGRFLWSHNMRSANIAMDLIDADHYELKNKTRMPFPASENFTNKAVAKAIELAHEFGDRLVVRPIPEYVAEDNIAVLVGEHDVVFLAVDNFKTRKLVSDHCEVLHNIVLFSGGNNSVEAGQDGTFGNVQIYERRGGKNVRNPITTFHPEIQVPADRAPYELSCEELALSSAPQLLFTNLAVASALLNAFYSWLRGRLDYEEASIDIIAGKVQPAYRGLANQDRDRPPPVAPTSPPKIST
jgi:molybdopterin/thiamine biosynthesis adenylyltransferase